jgi:hypothetical protein
MYLGEMIHKGKSFPGEHASIVDRALWDAAHAVLSKDTQERRVATMTRNSPVALLRGLLYAPNGKKMIPSAVVRKAQGGKRYRYYLDSKNARFGKGPDTFGTLGADQIEGLVIEHVVAALQSPASVQAVWDAVRTQTSDIDEPHVVLAMNNLGAIWQTLFPAEQVRIVNLLIERVQLTQESVEIRWRQAGWAALVGEFKVGTIGAELAELELAERELA